MSHAQILTLDGDDEGLAFGWEMGADEPSAEESLVSVDDVLAPGDVLARIEDVVSVFLQDVAEGRDPSLKLVSRSRGNVAYQPAAAQQGQGQLEAGMGGGVALGLGHRMTTRQLLSSRTQGAYAFARVFRVLEVVHELVRSGRHATQRDFYYKMLAGTALFRSATDANSAIQDCVSLLRVPRALMGVCCASRGTVSGMLQIKDGPMNPWQDCSESGMGGRAIPGNLQEIEGMALRSTARYLLVIEKDAIFQALTQDRIFDTLPCVLVTGKGQPDLATRFFCNKLVESFPSIKVLGLVDWNPAGVSILKTFKFGSSASLEGSRFTLPSLKWLGLRSDMLAGDDHAKLTALTARDDRLMPGLLSTLSTLGEPEWRHEVQEMMAHKAKAEIEMLYSGDGGMAGMAQVLVRTVTRGEYV
ncbi:hypothetical protein FOA52_006702 [Chlamydomonas sp. UWO 241]|nr:hypothetical protein FOA52_006702 [Chlamydomonas sp. UWO 241]